MTTNFDRRQFLRIVGLGVAATSVLGGCAPRARQEPQSGTFYVGTYTRGDSEGIYQCGFDPISGSVEILGATGGIENPSFLTINPNRNYLYATGETSEFDGESGGAVYAYAIDGTTGALRLVNVQSSRGGGPCYVSTTPQGGHVLVANYGGGNVAVLPIRDDGGLHAASDEAQHEGSSVNPKRQQGPHAHCIITDQAGRYAFAVDLGLDRVLIYRFDADEGALHPADQPFAQTEPGAGPRHMTFHPDGSRAYVINELNSTVSAFDYDPDRGALTQIQTITTLPEGYSAENYPADIHVHPNGRYLYGSNRGHDSIVVYAIESDALRMVQHQPTGGEWPRNFAIDPSGKFLLAANQNSHTINVFLIDEKTGELSSTDHSLDIPSPVCVRFI